MPERLNLLTVNRQLSTHLAPAYNTEFDLKNPENPQIKKNIETDLGERFNVVISRVEYEFEGQFLKAKDANEPFIQTIRRGIENRRQYANLHDRKRELVEFEGFNKVQSYLALQAGQSENQSVIVISPRGPEGSCYQHNFFDHYQKTPYDKILMTRYSSQMAIDEFLDAARIIDAKYGAGETVDDVYFLKNPITTILTKEQILSVFHPNHNALKEEELTSLLTVCQPLIQAYIASLVENPSSTNNLRRALLNFADDYIFKPNSRKFIASQLQDPDFVPIFATQLAARPVRHVITGCGVQGDLSAVNGQWSVVNFPYSVAEFGAKSEDRSDFRCPGKNADGSPCTYIVRFGSGVRKCPECGKEATCR